MDKTLKAIYQSGDTPLTLGTTELPCYVLEDGTRVFSGRGIQKAIGANPNASGTWLKKYIKDSPITPYLNPGLLDSFENPIKFARPGAGGSQSTTYGYEVTLLIDICDSIIEANKSRVKVPKKILQSAELIIRAAAKTGIIALVDEATGYVFAKERAKDELQKFFEKALQLEASKWVKTFSDEFFQMIFKMKGWTWVDTTKKPGVVGHYINDLVYSRIAPNVLKELKALNPKIGKTRKNRHHQHLTTDFGHPLLKEHLAALIALGKASSYNWQLFHDMVDKAYPKFGQTLQLDFAIQYDNKKLSNESSDFDQKLNKALSYNPKDK